MRSISSLLAITLAFAIPQSAFAQTTPADTGHAHAAEQPVVTRIDVAAGAEAAVTVVDAFGKALSDGAFEQVEAMLDPGVIVLESGGAERSRDEYMGHHAKSDATFLASAHSTLSRRTARVDGNTAWVASESELHANKDGKPMTLSSTETMVLSNTPSGWKIVHIHWSSRPKKS